MTQARRVALNSLAAYVRFAVSLAVQFALVPFVIARVGADDYGLWTLTFSVLGIVSLVDFGFTTGVVRFVAEARGLRDPERRNRVVSTILVVYLGLALVAALAVAVLAAFYADLFDLPADLRDRALLLLCVLAARSVLVTLPLVLFKAILFGEQHIALTNAIQVVTTLLYGGAAWATLTLDQGIVGLAIVNVATLLVEHLAYVFACFYLLRDLRISRSLVDRHALRETASVSIHQFVVNVGDQVLMRTDPIIIKLFLPLQAVALYGVALKVAENALLLLKQGVHVLGPWVAEMKARGEDERIRFVLLSGSKFTLAPGVALAAVVGAFAAEALDFWVGPDFREAAPVLVLLMSAMALMIPQVVAQSVFTMTGLHRLSAHLSLVGVVTNIGLSVALVGPLGLPGVAAATLATALLVNLLVIGVMARRHYRAGFRAWAQGVFLPALAPGLATLAISLALKALLPPRDLLAIAGLALPGLLAYAVLFWLFSVTPEERRILRERLFRPAATRPGPDTGPDPS